MKFPHDSRFDAAFDQIPDLIWYPYVGRTFADQETRIMVFGHNAYMDPVTNAARKADFAQKNAYTGTLEEFTYWKVWYTRAFRAFVKGAVGLTKNFGDESDPAVIAKVDNFIDRISHINFIQGLVESPVALTLARPEQIRQSIQINERILEVLGITHVICWGDHVFDYVMRMDGITVLRSQQFNQRGFSQRLIKNKLGRQVQVLKVFHPSMPGGFKPYSPEIQQILADFLPVAPKQDIASEASDLRKSE